MIVLCNTTAQTLKPGESLIFDNTVIQSGSAEHHADNSASVLMLKPGMYEIHFTGNVAGVTDESTMMLGVRVGSNTLLETTMMNTACLKECYSNVAEIHFTGNVAGVTDESTMMLGVRVGSNTLLETTMMNTACLKECYSNVASATIVRCETKGMDIGVTNIGTTPITIAPHSSIFVKRVA